VQKTKAIDIFRIIQKRKHLIYSVVCINESILYIPYC